MLFMYDYNTEYTTAHSATCYDEHVYTLNKSSK